MFYLCIDKMTLTLQDIAMLTSLLIDSVLVTRLEGLVDIDNIYGSLLGCMPMVCAYKDNNIKLTWLKTNFKTS